MKCRTALATFAALACMLAGCTPGGEPPPAPLPHAGPPPPVMTVADAMGWRDGHLEGLTRDEARFQAQRRGDADLRNRCLALIRTGRQVMLDQWPDEAFVRQEGTAYLEGEVYRAFLGDIHRTVIDMERAGCLAS